MSSAPHPRVHRLEPAGPGRLLTMSLLGILVGICGGLIAEGLLKLIEFITDVLFYGRFSAAYLPPSAAPIHWWTLLLPAAGGFLVGLLIHYFSPEIKGDGIPEAMTVVLTARSLVRPRVGFFKPLSAALTVGTGGPFGAEGPIIQTGGAVGSIISQLIPASTAERRTLLACGAAAGLAGVFKTPFGATLMAVELLVSEFRARSFIPIALASVASTLVAMAFRGTGAVFPIHTAFHLHPLELPFFVILGIGAAALAVLMTRALYFFEDWFEGLHLWFPLIPMIGGLVVGGIGFFYPQVFGMGYNVIGALLGRPHAWTLLTGVGLAKLAAFSVALGSGSSGGTFAPALMIGGSLGAAFGILVHSFLPYASSLGLYGMVATGALFGGIYRATATAILFMLEVTGAYNAWIPLFLVCIVGDLAIHYFMDTTINTERLYRRGIPVPEAYTADPMRLLRARDVMNAAVDSIPATRTVREFLPTAAQHETLPVVDVQDHVLGLLHRADLLHADPDASAGSLVRPGQFPTAFSDELVHDIALRLLEAGQRACPVLDRETHVLAGIITAYDLLKSKQWENLQELREPGTLRLFNLARFREKSPSRAVAGIAATPPGEPHPGKRRGPHERRKPDQR